MTELNIPYKHYKLGHALQISVGFDERELNDIIKFLSLTH
jgi:hypothetical protein